MRLQEQRLKDPDGQKERSVCVVVTGAGVLIGNKF